MILSLMLHCLYFPFKKLPMVCFKDNAARQHGNVQNDRVTCISPSTLVAQG